MINKGYNLIILIPLAISLTSCQVKQHLQNKLNTNSTQNTNKKFVKETTEVSISCNKDTIQNYIDKGWKVISSSTTEQPCSWKTVKASKGCNLQRDKGCKITVPDLIGEKTTYILEKETLIEGKSKDEQDLKTVGSELKSKE